MKILVVENDPQVREVVGLALSRSGYDVEFAEDGEQALVMADHADVVVLDWRLPKLSGEDVIRSIRGSGNYLPIIVTSTCPGKDAEKRLAGFDIVEFVQKPFSPKEIVEKVSKFAKISKDISEIRRGTDRLQGFIARQASVPRVQA